MQVGGQGTGQADRSAQGDGYDQDEVAVINGIIERSSLGWKKDAPVSWNTVPLDGNGTAIPYVKWGGSTQKQIEELSIVGSGLSDTLDVTGLSSLQYLDCNSNSLTGLDLTSLSNLQYLLCYDSPLQRLTLPGGKTLMIGIAPAGGGKVSIENVDITNQTMGLIPAAEAGYTFTVWSGDADGSGSPCPLTLD